MTLAIRATLLSALQAEFPDWIVLNAESVPDSTDRPAVLISQRSVGPLTEAPATHFSVGLTLTLVASASETQTAEDELDGNIIDLWETLSSSPTVIPTAASKLVFNNRMAYDVTVQAIISKD